jgi:cytochrome P450 PksS
MVTTTDIGWDVYDWAAIARPHRFYARLRREAPIARSDQLQSWVLTRYEDVRSVLRDPEQWSSLRPEGGNRGARPDQPRETVAPQATLTMLSSDPPDHTRLRRLLDRDFTPGRIMRLAPHVEEITARLLAGAAARPQFDVAEELAVPLPVTVIAELLGIPPALGPQFKRWSDAAIETIMPDTTDEAIALRNAQIVQFRAYLLDQIEKKRRVPTDDFIGRLVQAHDAEERLTDDELLAAVNLLLLAGNETTTNLISNATLALWKFPEQQQALRDDPALIDDAIEEFLRYDGSVQFTGRRANSPVQFYDQAIAPGEQVAVVLASANRDERVFENPDVLDLRRGRSKHLAFGDWIHVCLGQYLARVETKAAILALLREFEAFELAVPEDEIVYRPNFNLRGPKYLPIRPL